MSAAAAKSLSLSVCGLFASRAPPGDERGRTGKKSKRLESANVKFAQQLSASEI
jgi:hypothetical protein